MTLLRIIVRSSIRRSLHRCLLRAIRSRQGCSPVSTLRFDSSREKGLIHLYRVYLTNQHKLKVCKWLLSLKLMGPHHHLQQAQSFKLPEKEHIRKGPRRTTAPGWVISHLNFFSFARVSRTFRASALSVKMEFLGSKGPLVAVITSRATRSCSFFDLSARTAYRTKLQKFCGRTCIGISSGFLILQSRASNLMLTNPMTSQRVDFPQMLSYFYTRPVLSDKCIFAYTRPQPGVLAVALNTTTATIQFRRSGDSEWSIFSNDHGFRFRDIIAFGQRIYALAYNAFICHLSLRSPPTIQFIYLKDRPDLSPCAKLVASINELLVVDFVMGQTFQIYRVDFANRQWVRVHDLGDRSLFLSELKSSRICSATSWGLRANSIYYLGYKEECLVYFATNPPVLIDRFPITPGNNGRPAEVWYGWYMPNEALKLDCVWDDRYPYPPPAAHA